MTDLGRVWSGARHMRLNAMGGIAEAGRRAGMGAQIQDFSVQLASGQGAMTAFIQHEGHGQHRRHEPGEASSILEADRSADLEQASGEE